ncbi:hypothetical protein N0O92_21425 [Alkalihalobacillus sp. MEB130]|uniref:hypothetical protein n=1 Tax=Alkalihalobacillus sp. MEB130 TaxID=2976704 RepID=UPI0028E02B7B|nr:hypothetical protein [Alkalihalobacillus sp. MEB130]MDT8862755.1 hypothetical protein [Alkalihalobacillus sp. MEB130]
MEQTDQQLKKALLKLEEALNHYEDLLATVEETSESRNSNLLSIRSLKVRISEKQRMLDPSTQFEDITENNIEQFTSRIPSGHDVTLFYKRSPFQTSIVYHSEPVNPKPWLSYIVYKQKELL